MPGPVPMLQMPVGRVGIFDQVRDPYRIGLEFQFRPFGAWQLIPAIGAAAAQNDAHFVYSDLKGDFNDLEFRSGIELSYRFSGRSRIGVALFHLSNGGLSNQNPGTEVLVLSFSIPLQGSWRFHIGRPLMKALMIVTAVKAANGIHHWWQILNIPPDQPSDDTPSEHAVSGTAECNSRAGFHYMVELPDNTRRRLGASA